MPQQNKNTAAPTLVIRKNGKPKLSKQQLAFNKLTQKINSLRSQIKDTIKVNDECLAHYSANLYPLEQRGAALRTELIKLLYNIYCGEKYVSKKEKKTIKEVILQQIDDVFGASENHDDELKAIFNKLSGENYDAIAQQGFDEGMQEMESMFSDMGLDIDMSNINKDDDMATVMRKLQEQLEAANASGDHEQPKQKKTKRQLADEAREKELDTVREQSVKNIYRQLVKVLHPDLEQNEDLRIEKEALMKELTIAYKNNDLHTLLKLELHWIQQEKNHLEELTDEKLKIYNELLKEQVSGLQQELILISQHPRYLPLLRFFDFGNPNIKTLKIIANRLQQTIQSMQHSINNLKNGNVKPEIAEIISLHKMQAEVANQLFDGWDWEDDDF